MRLQGESFRVREHAKLSNVNECDQSCHRHDLCVDQNRACGIIAS